MSRAARFEVVQSDSGFFARFRAANGRKLWQTEVYARRARVDRVISLITDSHIYIDSNGIASVFLGTEPIEVRDVDERTEATS